MFSRPTLAILVALASGSSGCSLLAVQAPAKSQKASIGVSCTDERYAPALDAGMAGASLGTALFGERSTGTNVALAVSTIAWGGSALYGYLVTGECQKAKDALSRYHTKLLLRQIDLLNEAAGQDDDEDEAKPPELPSPPPPAPPIEEYRPAPPAYVPPPPAYVPAPNP
jgi:hypothetical protein